MSNRIALLLGSILLLTGTANAQQSCPTLYSSDLTNEQLVEAEQAAIKVRFAAFPGANAPVFQNCQVKVKAQQNADASRSRKGHYGMQETVSGIETVSIIKCDVQSANKNLTGFFKIIRFERISEPKGSQFAAHSGCDQFTDRNSHATVIYSATEVQ